MKLTSRRVEFIASYMVQGHDHMIRRCEMAAIINGEVQETERPRCDLG